MSWLQASRSLCMPFGPGLSFKPQASVLVSVLSRLPYLCALLSTYDSLTSVDYFILSTPLRLRITLYLRLPYVCALLSSCDSLICEHYFPLTTPLLLWITLYLRLPYFCTLLSTLLCITSHLRLLLLCITFHLRLPYCCLLVSTYDFITSMHYLPLSTPLLLWSTFTNNSHVCVHCVLST